MGVLFGFTIVTNFHSGRPLRPQSNPSGCGGRPTGFAPVSQSAGASSDSLIGLVDVQERVSDTLGAAADVMTRGTALDRSTFAEAMR